MKIVTSAEMRSIDRATSDRFGVSSLTLMENAGTAVADVALASYPYAKTFAVICGKGNNGGDGFVIARKLHQAGREVRLLLLADPAELHGDAAANFSRLQKNSLARDAQDKPNGGSLAIFNAWGEPAFREIFSCDVLIDAILGSGFQPPVSGVYAEAIAKINSAPGHVIAVDVPSGVAGDSMDGQTGIVARADAIVTFTAPRPAHVFGNLSSGPTLIASIGSPPEAIESSLNLEVITPLEIAQLMAPRPRDSNKGMYGHVLVAGGSLGKAGAAAMAGFSALRAGAGLVTVASPRSCLELIAGYHPELMTEPLEETDAGSISKEALDQFNRLAHGKTVLAIGPGISRHPSTTEFVRTVVTKSETAVVLDADGLNAFEGSAQELNGGEKTLVLTPHPGEMARLTGLSIPAIQRDRINVARSFARDHKLILVLKGDRTIIASPQGEAWVNTTGNPGMATGGTGDILTGIVAGMVAQNPQRAFQAVLAAVYLHGLAGDVAEESTGEQSLVATDLITALPEAFRRIRARAAEKWVKIGDWRTAAA
ncbi:MAG TPA: NAD(P)H-hydrate dehydratase [Terriglobales bacterium]|jgi:NAD(P)H-hydrate epimerase|nr:NAD(P)H-hydrate dehydratase [Terriglobales bacterium]